MKSFIAKILFFAFALCGISAAATNQSSTQQMQIQVQDITALTITTTSLPNAVRVAGVGQPYSATITAVGGVAPYLWSVSQGTLPAGLSLTANCSTATCAITGAPLAAAASSTFTIQVTDNSGAIAQVQLKWDASTSQNVTAYNIYRGTASGGPYTKVGQSSSLTFSDSLLRSLQKAFYVATALDSSGHESVFSNEAMAVLQ